MSSEHVDEPLSAPPGWHDPPGDDVGDVAKALQFIKACPLTMGEPAKRDETLGHHWMPWEDKLTRHIFGTLRDDGTRRYDTVYVEMPKGSGKSHYAAALALKMTIADGEYGAQVYSAGQKKEQAKVVWGIALQMCKMQPKLTGPQRADISKQYKNTIQCPRLAAIYKPLPRKAKGQHGMNPHCVIFDELHEQRDRDLWDTIKRSMGKRAEPLLFAITNAGHDRESLCYEMHDYALKVNEGWIEDDSFLGLIYGADPDAEDYDWTEPDVWERANPGIGTTVRRDYIERECREAQVQVTAQNSFKRWHLGVWTEQETKWLDPEDWAAAKRDYTEAELIGRTCYGGLDLGASDDLSAWALAFPWENGTVRLLCRAWCAEHRVRDPGNPYRDQYQAWARDGWLEVIEGRVMDSEPVESQILADRDRFGLVDMAMDKKFQGIDLSIRLLNVHGIEVAGMGTGYTSMSAPCREFERRLKMDPPQVVHNGNPVLRWAVGNVVLKEGRKKGQVMPDKDSRSAKIDPVVAALMAFDRAMRHEAFREEPSVYEERGLRVIGMEGESA